LKVRQLKKGKTLGPEEDFDVGKKIKNININKQTNKDKQTKHKQT